MWNVGSGTQINLWKDNWLGIGPICNFVHGPLNLNDQSLLVSHIIKDNQWNLSPLSFPLPDFIEERILSMPIHFHQDHDTTFSTFVEQGKFSIAQAYHHIIDLRSSLMDSDWIWKLKLLPKLKFFIWLIWWDRLPQRDMLFKCRITENPFCPVCHSNPEISLHALRDCDKASQVWALIDPPRIFRNQTNEVKGLQWKSFFPFLCFEIWKARNKFVFENKTHDPAKITLDRAFSLAWDFYVYQPKSRPNHPHTRLTR